MALQQTAFTGSLPATPQPSRSRPTARRQMRVRASSSPTRPPPAKPMRRPFSSPLPQWQRLWAVGKQGREPAHSSVLEQRAEGHLGWADGLEEHYRTGKTVGRGALPQRSRSTTQMRCDATAEPAGIRSRFHGPPSA